MQSEGELRDMLEQKKRVINIVTIMIARPLECRLLCPVNNVTVLTYVTFVEPSLFVE